jgi:hypothetical protein
MTNNRDSATTDITRRVAAGVALLDEQRPDWDQAIDLHTLQISSCTRCVLGQLHSDVSHGYAEYGIDDNDAWRFGFDQYGIGCGKAEYSLLTAEWKRVISERRTAVAR